MDVKLLEARASGTLYAVMAIKLSARNEAERWLLARSGYGETAENQETYVISGLIDPCVGPNGDDLLHFSYDGYAWTFPPHQDDLMQWLTDYLTEHWEELESGQVIDYDYIHERRATPRISDRLVEQERSRYE